MCLFKEEGEYKLLPNLDIFFVRIMFQIVGNSYLVLTVVKPSDIALQGM